MTNNHAYVNTVLKHLYDSVNGIRECAKQVAAPSFKQKLDSIANEREAFANELKTALTQAGVDHEQFGSIAGPLHRLYIDLKGMLTGGNAETINNEFKRGDETLIDAYKDALANDVDLACKTILTKQLAVIEKNQIEVDISALQASA